MNQYYVILVTVQTSQSWTEIITCVIAAIVFRWNHPSSSLPKIEKRYEVEEVKNSAPSTQIDRDRDSALGCYCGMSVYEQQ